VAVTDADTLVVVDGAATDAPAMPSAKAKDPPHAIAAIATATNFFTVISPERSSHREHDSIPPIDTNRQRLEDNPLRKALSRKKLYDDSLAQRRFIEKRPTRHLQRALLPQSKLLLLSVASSGSTV
jgi:hypothetical protein